MTAGMILFAIISGLAINEFCDLSPWLARKLVRWSAYRRYANRGLAEDRADELAAVIDARPGKLFKLGTALGFVTAAIAVSVVRAAARWIPASGRRLVERLQARRGRSVAPILFTDPDAPLVVMDTSMHHGDEALDAVHGTSYVNRLECEWAVDACRAIDSELARRGRTATVSVLTYYRAQADEIRHQLDLISPTFRRLQLDVVGTIDEAIGQDSDYVIISFCRSSRTVSRPKFASFLQNARRLHVALTRARRTVVLVGHATTLRRLDGVDPEFAHLFTRLIDMEGTRIMCCPPRAFGV